MINKKALILSLLVNFLISSTNSYAYLIGQEETVLGANEARLALDVDPQGNVHIVCMHGRGIVYNKKPVGGNWDVGGAIAVPVGEGALGQFSHPDVAGDFQGNAHITWADGTNDRIWYVNNVSGRWSEPRVLASAYGPEYADAAAPQIAVDSNGLVHIAFNRAFASAWSIRHLYSADNGITWSPETRMFLIERDAQFPALAADQSGNIHGVATVGGKVYYNFWNGSTRQWASDNGEAVSLDNYVDRFYNAVSGQGTPIVVWHPYSLDPFAHLLEVLFSRKFGGSWTAPETASDYGIIYPELPGWPPLPRAVSITDDEIFIFYANWIYSSIYMSWFKSGYQAEKNVFVGNAGASYIDADYHGSKVVVAYWRENNVRYVEITAGGTPSTNKLPVILVGGYYGTDITEIDGGVINLIAAVVDPQSSQNIRKVELYYGKSPTGVYLADDGQSGDFSAADSIYGLRVEVPPAPDSVPAGKYLLEIVATNRAGYQSTIYPYLTVSNPRSQKGIDFEIEGFIEPLNEDYWLIEYFNSVNGFSKFQKGSETHPPVINVAGYWYTNLTYQQGGRITVLAWVTDPDDDIERVQLYVDGKPTDIYLSDSGPPNDWTAGDNFYTFITNIGSGTYPGEYLIEIGATDEQGNQSQLWPYLNVPLSKSPLPTPTPTPPPPTATPTSTPTEGPCNGYLDCSSPEIIKCGEPYSGNTSTAGVANAYQYNCDDVDLWIGKEVVHKVRIGGGKVIAELTGFYPKNMNVFLLHRCCETSCDAIGQYINIDKKRAEVNNAPAGDYFIVVDSSDISHEGAYTLSVTCTSQGEPTPTPTPTNLPTVIPSFTPGELNCNDPIPITCGQSYSGNTSYGSSAVNHYGNCSNLLPDMNGPEIVHALDVPNFGQLTIEITNTAEDVYFFMLYMCNENMCISYGKQGTPIVFPSFYPGVFYLVVDSVSAGGKSYTLSITCSGD